MNKNNKIRTIIVMPESLEAYIMKNNLRHDEQLFMTKAGEKPDWKDLEKDITEKIKETYNRYLKVDKKTGEMKHEIKIAAIDITGQPDWIDKNDYIIESSEKHLRISGPSDEYTEYYLKDEKDTAIEKIAKDLKENRKFGDIIKDNYIDEWYKKNNLESNYLKVEYSVHGNVKKRGDKVYRYPLTKRSRDKHYNLEWSYYDGWDQDFGYYGENSVRVAKLIYVDNEKREIDLTNALPSFRHIEEQLMNFLDKNAGKQIETQVETACRQKAEEIYETIKSLDKNLQNRLENNSQTKTLSDLWESYKAKKTLERIDMTTKGKYIER